MPKPGRPGYGRPRGGGTLIVGGGFHVQVDAAARPGGRVTQVVWDHVPGDGRERVVAHRDTFKLRAETGGPVTRQSDVQRLRRAHLPPPRPPGHRRYSPPPTPRLHLPRRLGGGFFRCARPGVGRSDVLLIDEDTAATKNCDSATRACRPGWPRSASR
ncbi:P-loop domain-containing protein [Mesorhizobium calcicola]|uniref:P-loop domain-containing protein n=1 Tax=Mesorhizobium calcicola TaxID=1300310 RepID=A0ABW4W7P2_9HYPH